MIKEITLKTAGMSCPSCENTISNALLKVDGILEVKANYSEETSNVIYDESRVDVKTIIETVQRAGYVSGFLEEGRSRFDRKFSFPYGIFFVLIGALLISYIYLAYGSKAQIFTLEKNITLPVLFFFGLITGVHCIGMCGSFVLAYSSKNGVIKTNSSQSHLEYGVGKLISYTVIGGLLGWIGSIISFTPGIRGAIGVCAGIFLIIYGLGTLNVFPVLRKLGPYLPGMRVQTKEPFIIGIANGLFLACGPLTAIYIYAAGTGDPVSGGLSLFAFGLGTLPSMMIFGLSLNSISKYLHRIMKFSGIILIILGIIMANNSLALLGSGFDYESFFGKNVQEAKFEGDIQVIKMTVGAEGWKPDIFALRKGVKVKWIIFVEKLTSCNNEIIVRDYGIDIKLKEGENIVEFTPVREGAVKWSCWMGMIPGTFFVK